MNLYSQDPSSAEPPVELDTMLPYSTTDNLPLTSGDGEYVTISDASDVNNSETESLIGNDRL